MAASHSLPKHNIGRLPPGLARVEPSTFTANCFVKCPHLSLVRLKVSALPSSRLAMLCLLWPTSSRRMPTVSYGHG